MSARAKRLDSSALAAIRTTLLCPGRLPLVPPLRVDYLCLRRSSAWRRLIPEAHLESIMNRSIWTWIQLAVSLTNAIFLVISHLSGPISEADIASLLVGQAGHRVLAKAARAINPLSHGVETTL
jgi:hypothetical protein